MIQDYTVLEPRHGKFFADLIWLLVSEATPTQYRDQFAGEGMQVNELLEFPRTQYGPAFAYARSGSDAFVWMEGTSNADQSIQQAGSYTGGVFASINDPVSDANEIRATEMMNALFASPIQLPTRIYMGGWSYGGSIVQYAIPKWIAKGVSATNVFCSTFGSPRIGGQSVCRSVGACRNINRWFHAYDPVPLVPPRMSETGIVAGLFGPSVARRLANFCHPYEGTQLNADGTLTDQMLPSSASVNFNSSLAAWLRALDQEGGSAHSISTYSRSLQTAAERRVRVASSLSHRIEPTETISSRQVNQVARRIEGELNELAARSANVPPQMPVKYKFAAVKIGRVYTVTWQDQNVCTVPHRRRAQSIANSGNAFLKLLLKSAVVDPIAIAGLMQLWVTAAQTDGAGFVPTMNTVYPDGKDA